MLHEPPKWMAETRCADPNSIKLWDLIGWDIIWILAGMLIKFRLEVWEGMLIKRSSFGLLDRVVRRIWRSRPLKKFRLTIDSVNFNFFQIDEYLILTKEKETMEVWKSHFEGRVYCERALSSAGEKYLIGPRNFHGYHPSRMCMPVRWVDTLSSEYKWSGFVDAILNGVDKRAWLRTLRIAVTMLKRRRQWRFNRPHVRLTNVAELTRDLSPGSAR
jgi:hypothetical protein